MVNLISKDTHLLFFISRKASQFNKCLKALHGKLNIKNTHLVFSVFIAGLCMFSEEELERLTFNSRCGSHAAVINSQRTAHRPKYVKLKPFLKLTLFPGFIQA